MKEFRDECRKEDRLVVFLTREIHISENDVALQLIKKCCGRRRAEELYLQRMRLHNERMAADYRANPHKHYGSKPPCATPSYDWFVVDGAGTIKIKALVHSHNGGGHNWWCCSRRDVYFNDFDGNKWWGVHLAQTFKTHWYPFSNDVVRCRKLKKR